LIEGTHRNDRHGEPPRTTPGEFQPLRKPSNMRGEAARAWKRYIEPAVWLDIWRMPSAIAFCELFAEFVANPASFPASRHGQMRGYLADLGLSDERNRPSLPQGQTDEFFDD
jgi:hypothetical protein